MVMMMLILMMMMVMMMMLMLILMMMLAILYPLSDHHMMIFTCRPVWNGYSPVRRAALLGEHTWKCVFLDFWIWI